MSRYNSKTGVVTVCRDALGALCFHDCKPRGRAAMARILQQYSFGFCALCELRSLMHGALNMLCLCKRVMLHLSAPMQRNVPMRLIHASGIGRALSKRKPEKDVHVCAGHCT